MTDRHINRRRLLIAMGAAGGSAVALRAGTPAFANTGGRADKGLVVETRQGRVRGERAGAVRCFKGIPYAEPPVGAKRFLAPTAPRSWKGVRDATALGHPSVQFNPDFPAWLDPEQASEDCLYLNVWTPTGSSGRAKPVMVWIHGGAFSYGSAGAPVYDGAHLAESADVVVVSINHRLNIFGYLWLGDVIPELADHANPGQQDLVAALSWVRHNIRGFGGDPCNVTIFGESGGGAKVGALLATPTARGLFHKAIIESGSQLGVMTREEANHVTSTALDALGGGVFTLERLLGLSADEFEKAALAVQGKLPGLPFQPVVDGHFIPRQTWKNGAPADSRGIPMIIGTNSDEAAVFLPDMAEQIDTDEELRRRFLHGPTPQLTDEQFQQLLSDYRRVMPSSSRLELLVAMVTDLWMWHSALIQAEHKVADGAGPVYFYEFAWRTPCFGSSWAVHAGELPFVFGNLDYPTAWDGTDSDTTRSADDPTGQRFLLAHQMMRAWGAFAHHGDPFTVDLKWPAYDTRTRPTMLFDRGRSAVVKDRNAERRHLIAPLPTVW
ncbi:carboxylesterase/lipase family protein [Streptomyces ardesiacus]|uniref:carboxylesterase/lipase family protein n=1 Tax=Streptomyces ardesiacus TaxID=285564 RepID=UPI00365980FD